MTGRVFAVVVGVATLALARTAGAHDPFEITALARLNASELVVEVTMARSTALRLATGRGGPRETFAPNAFPGHHAKLLALAPSLYAITSDGAPLPLHARSVTLTEERDVLYVLASAAPPGALVRFRAAHLGMLPEGYTSALGVATTGEEPTHFKLLVAADPVLAVDHGGAPGLALVAKRVLEEYAPLLLLLGALAGGRLAERLTRRGAGAAHRAVHVGE
ncbi:MAG TPA: hypothetical protein VFZ53_25110 [Polyangiaceae bacterium]